MQYYEGKLNHIWVDLFILDKLPASRAGAEFTRFLHKAVYGMAMGHRYKLDFGKYSLIHKIFWEAGCGRPPGAHEAYLCHAEGSCPEGQAQQGESALLQ